MEIKGKIISFLGDSITEGHGVRDISHRYDNVILRDYGVKAVHNYGVGGSRLAHQRIPSEKPRFDLCFCGRAYDMARDSDIIVVYGGVNDYIHGDAPIGQYGDKTPATFWGAVEFLMSFLPTQYPNAKIAFVTPARTIYQNIPFDLPSRRPNKLPDAMPLRGYADVIEVLGKEHGIPVLNLIDELGIDPTNPEDREKYTCDGLHFNDDGHEVLGKKIAEFLLKI